MHVFHWKTKTWQINGLKLVLILNDFLTKMFDWIIFFFFVIWVYTTHKQEITAHKYIPT